MRLLVKNLQKVLGQRWEEKGCFSLVKQRREIEECLTRLCMQVAENMLYNFGAQRIVG